MALTGTRIGPYVIDRELGRGGMSVVFAARHAELDRTVALKVLPPSMAQDPECAARFERESRLLARFRHPSVVRVLDGDPAGQPPYLAMELVADPTLARVAADAHGRPRALPVRHALRLTANLLDAVGAVHAAGILHRDVKPSNTFVSATGRVRLADFGLARHWRDPALTETGYVCGTPEYLAPEQFEDGEADERSDLYAVGLVLARLLCGRLPFGDTVAAAAAAKLAGPTLGGLRGVTPDLPAPALALVERACRRDPAERPQSAAEFRGYVCTALDLIG